MTWKEDWDALRNRAHDQPVVRTFTARNLEAIGRALYGTRWQSPLARDLGVRYRTIRRWMTGERGLPAGLADDLDRLLRARAGQISSLTQD